MDSVSATDFERGNGGASDSGWEVLLAAATTTVTGDKGRYLVYALLCFPLAYVHREWLPSARARHAFALVFGAAGVLFVFGAADAKHFLLSSSCVYAICALGPRRHAGWLSFAFCMAYLSYGHFARQYYTYLSSARDWTSPQMLLTIRLTSLAFCYADGGSVAASKGNRFALSSMPPPLEFFSYVFFFAAFIGGPICEMKEYLAFTDRSMFASEPGGRVPGPSASRAALRYFLYAVIGTMLLPVNRRFNELHTTTPEFLELPYFSRLIYVVVAVESGFWKYYFAFYIQHAASTMAGLTYHRAQDGEVRWDRIEMLRLWRFKTATHPKELSANWNIGAALWLQRYVYVRLLPPRGSRPALGRREFAYLATFLVSAVWHGFYPGYYLFFASLALWGLVVGLLMSFAVPILWPPGREDAVYPLLNALNGAILYVAIIYHTLAFRLMDWDYALRGWASLDYFPHKLWLVCLPTFAAAALAYRLLGGGALKRKK